MSFKCEPGVSIVVISSCFFSGRKTRKNIRLTSLNPFLQTRNTEQVYLIVHRSSTWFMYIVYVNYEITDSTRKKEDPESERESELLIQMKAIPVY